MLGKIERFNHQLSGWFERIGVAAMMVMMLTTCIDVIGAKVFKSPILGALDIVQLCQIVAIAFAASMALIVGRHIRVEFFFDLLPRRVQVVINFLVLLIVLGLFLVIIWQVCLLGYSFQTSGEYSPTAYIPLYPFAYAVALAFIPVCLVLIQEFLKALKQKEDK